MQFFCSDGRQPDLSGFSLPLSLFACLENGLPVLSPAKHAQDGDIAVRENIDDQMALMSMDANRRDELGSLPCHRRHISNQLKRMRQTVDIGIGLLKRLGLGRIAPNRVHILDSLWRQPIGHRPT